MAPKVKTNNMPYTDQRNFVRSVRDTFYSPFEIDYGVSEIDRFVDVEDVLKAFKHSAKSNVMKDRILSDFSKDNLISITRNHIENVKTLIRNGKLDDNIQTKDNDRNTKEYDEYNLSNMEKTLLSDINRLNNKKKDEIYNYNPTDKEIVSNFVSSLDPKEIGSMFSDLKNKLFKSHVMRSQEHDYDFKAQVKENISKRDLDNIAKKGVTDKRLEKEMKDKDDSILYRGETRKEDVIGYVKAMKEMRDMVKSRPWYVRWFSSEYSKQMDAIEKAKKELYDRGISKKSLNKFIKSNGSEQALEEFYQSNDNKIKEVNDKNKKALDEQIGKQEDINIKNFFREQEFSKSAQKTLDKVEESLDDLEFNPNDDYVETHDELHNKLDDEFDAEFTNEIVDAINNPSDIVNKEKEL